MVNVFCQLCERFIGLLEHQVGNDVTTWNHTHALCDECFDVVKNIEFVKKKSDIT